MKTQGQQATSALQLQQIAELQQENARMQRENQRLRALYARYRGCFDSSPLSMVFIGVDGRPVQANRAFERMYGMTIAQLSDRNFNIFNDPQLIENGTLPYMQRALAGETVIEPMTCYDASKTVAGGRFNWGQGFYYPIRDEAGVVREIVEMALDHTQLVEAQQALLQREQSAQERLAELEEKNQLLLRRDRVLEATASAASALLTIEDFDRAVNTALQIIGESLDTDRVSVMEHFDDPAGQSLGYVKGLYEWNSPNAISQLNHPELSLVSYDGIEEWYQLCRDSQPTGGLIDQCPEPFRSKMKEIGVKSLYAVPIMVDGKYWGIVGLDDCREALSRSTAELAILKTVAACIGSAIGQRRIRHAREEAERAVLLEREKAVRERAELLKTVTNVANQLLRSPDYTAVLPDVLQILGEAAKADRTSLVQNVTEPISGKAAVKMHTEWCRFGIQASIIHTPELKSALLWEYFPGFQEQLARGETITFLVKDLCEPARSILLEQGNTSMTLVPIAVRGFWGVFGFDYCGEVQLYDEDVRAIFAIAADSIAAALERQAVDDALRESEYRYRTLFELSNEGIYRFEFDPPLPTSLSIDEQIELCCQYFRYAEANNTFAAQYGIDNPEEIVGKRFVDFYLEGSKVNLETLRAIHENNFQLRNAESEEIDAYGQQRHFVWNIVSQVRDGYVWGGWGIQTDITELKKAEIALLCAEQERTAQLANANEALKQTLDVLAESPQPDKFLAHVLSAIARFFQSPLTEYWYHSESGICFVGAIAWHGCIYNREEIVQLYPDHPGVNGFQVPPETIREKLQHRKRYVTIDKANSGVKDVKWYSARNLSTEINVPMTLGNECIGSLVIHLPRSCPFTSQQIELAQALAHQATLAVKLTQLAQESRQATLLEERNRMAREIHDTLAQAFTGIVIQLQAAGRFLTNQPEQTSSCITRAQDLAKEGLEQARRSVWYLRQDDTGDNLDLLQTLTRIAEQMTAGTAVQADVCVQGTPYKLNLEVKVNLLRIATESLTNALRHALPQTIHTSISYKSDRVILRVQDDGQGFDPQLVSSGFGLVGMRQRCDRIGAQLEINSQLGVGTEVTVVLTK